MSVFFHSHEVDVRLKDRRKLKAFLANLFQKEGFLLRRLDYIFCNDAYLLKINQSYLHHNTYTDIITFDLSEKKAEKSAEIYISKERVKENAEIFGVPFEQELHRVIFHGVLHLCGYGDKTSSEKRQMRFKENEALQTYFNELT